MLKNLQPQFFKQIVIYGLLFVFWGTLNYFFESIPKGLNRIVFGILSFTYIFLYMKNRKSVSGNKGDLAIWILIISGFFAFGRCYLLFKYTRQNYAIFQLSLYFINNSNIYSI